MKRLLALLFWGVGTWAAAFPSPFPYFRPANFMHPDPIAGALIDYKDLGRTATTGLIPVVTHSPADGCLFPSFVCEDWTPLAIGGSMNAGQLTLDVAPLANILPWFQSAAGAMLPASWESARAIFAPAYGQQPVTFSAGPAWEYRQATNKGYFRIFTGVALHF